MLSDPGDDLVFETAVNGRADVIVTFNRRDFEPSRTVLDLRSLHPRKLCAVWRIADEEE
jgi:predicted nucleic acid-binding protein